LDGLIIDVGANRGDFTATVRQLEPRSTMIAVEPAPALAQSLRLRFHGDHAVTINARALADNEDGAVLHEAATAEFSSLLPVRGMAVLHDTPVETTTLDRLNAAPVRLLKLDVQGHEAAVLRGGIDTLGRTDAVLLEVVFTSQYEGDATFSSLDETMRGAGFALAGIGEPARYEGRATWTDACYVRDDLNLNQGLAATSP
jgi:FkbM family methyltransferase